MNKQKLLLTILLSWVTIYLAAQDGKLPIIDMHQHAHNKMWRTETGEPLPRICTPEPCVHAPAKYRVNGPLSNISEFYKTFNVKPSNKMYQADSLRVVIW